MSYPGLWTWGAHVLDWANWPKYSPSRIMG
ncbi:hypothetical protein A2U01_0101819, partial [Trifolium medium]|nr:hypothetical protein [Trifolium medium]